MSRIQKIYQKLTPGERDIVNVTVMNDFHSLLYLNYMEELKQEKVNFSRKEGETLEELQSRLDRLNTEINVINDFIDFHKRVINIYKERQQ